VEVVAASGVAPLVYVAYSWFLRVPELHQSVQLLLSVLRREAPPPTTP
jgi:hypothetical protein